MTTGADSLYTALTDEKTRALAVDIAILAFETGVTIKT